LSGIASVWDMSFGNRSVGEKVGRSLGLSLSLCVILLLSQKGQIDTSQGLNSLVAFP